MIPNIDQNIKQIRNRYKVGDKDKLKYHVNVKLLQSGWNWIQIEIQNKLKSVKSWVWY